MYMYVHVNAIGGHGKCPTAKQEPVINIMYAHTHTHTHEHWWSLR
jgi:hypothetical protein